jgi:hypothetical protein
MTPTEAPSQVTAPAPVPAPTPQHSAAPSAPQAPQAPAPAPIRASMNDIIGRTGVALETPPVTTQQQDATPAPPEVPSEPPAEPQEEPVFDLAAFEDDILRDVRPQAPVAPPPPVVTAPVVPPVVAATPPPAIPQGSPFNDGFTWEKPIDAYRDLEAAWDNKDTEGYARINQAIQHRFIQATLNPLVDELNSLKQQLQELAPVKQFVPRLQQEDHRSQLESNEAFVRGKLIEQAPQYAEMFTPPADKSTVVIEGVTVPATPINIVLAQFPWLLHANPEVPQGSSPDLVQRKKFMTMYTEGRKLWGYIKASRTPAPPTPPPAKDMAAAFQSGVQAAAPQRQQANPVREAINAPGNPTTPPAPTAPSYVDEWLRETPSPASFFRK